MTLSLAEIEGLAQRQGLKLRLRSRRTLGGGTFHVAAALPQADGSARMVGELRGWLLPLPDGLRLDTMRVAAHGAVGVGTLIWATTFAWALECTPCRTARLLAIRDGERQHRRLVRYFRQLGFQAERDLGSGLFDLAPRLLWGGAGLLMVGRCDEGLSRCERRLRGSCSAPEDHSARRQTPDPWPGIRSDRTPPGSSSGPPADGPGTDAGTAQR